MQKIETTPRIFSGETGPKLPQGFNQRRATPLDYFGLLFKTQLWQIILKWTNAYASFLKKTGKDDSYCFPTSISELKAFLGLGIIMGQNQRPCHKQFWQKSDDVGQTAFRHAITTIRSTDTFI